MKELRRKPQNQRSQAIVDAILGAAGQILVEQGYNRFNTNELARRAGVSIGTLYHYFDNKEAIVMALRRLHQRDVRVALVSVLDEAKDLPPLELIRQLVRADIKTHRKDPALHRVLSQEIPHVGPLEQRTENDPENDMTRLYQALHEAVDSLSDPAQRDADTEDEAINQINTSAFIIEALVHAFVVYSDREIPSQQIEDHIMQVVTAYLSSQGPANATVQ
ncbi:MAG: TetR/AcrR family transcriptional regulator [Alphaproteobacteria bacterium]|nr:TetR/AcrR family transcriptional regulator [Alphaproteobacteria bacterium SS10]